MMDMFVGWATVSLALITLVVGLLAIGMYWKQRRDSKKEAANIIWLEIKNAEKNISDIIQKKREVQNSSYLPNNILLPNDSWNKYKHFFIRDLGAESWDVVNNFYNDCKSYDEAVIYNLSSFKKNEENLRNNMYRIYGDIIKKCFDKKNIDPDLIAEISKGHVTNISEEIKKDIIDCANKAKACVNIYKDGAISNIVYSPDKPLNDAKMIFDNLKRDISQTSTGDKLKKLADSKI